MNGRSFRAALITKGRKTGKEHCVFLKAVMYNDMVYFSRHEPNSDWYKNALNDERVFVEFDNKRHSGKARAITDKELLRKISRLKYPGEDRAEEKRVAIEIVLNY